MTRNGRRASAPRKPWFLPVFHLHSTYRQIFKLRWPPTSSPSSRRPRRTSNPKRSPHPRTSIVLRLPPQPMWRRCSGNLRVLSAKDRVVRRRNQVIGRCCQVGGHQAVQALGSWDPRGLWLQAGHPRRVRVDTAHPSAGFSANSRKGHRVDPQRRETCFGYVFTLDAMNFN